MLPIGRVEKAEEEQKGNKGNKGEKGGKGNGAPKQGKGGKGNRGKGGNRNGNSEKSYVIDVGGDEEVHSCYMLNNSKPHPSYHAPTPHVTLSASAMSVLQGKDFDDVNDERDEDLPGVWGNDRDPWEMSHEHSTARAIFHNFITPTSPTPHPSPPSQQEQALVGKADVEEEEEEEVDEDEDPNGPPESFDYGQDDQDNEDRGVEHAIVDGGCSTAIYSGSEDCLTLMSADVNA